MQRLPIVTSTLALAVGDQLLARAGLHHQRHGAALRQRPG
jgi:hypothetical protein